MPPTGNLRDRPLSIVDDFAGVRVAILGDLLVDEFIYGRISRVSREAPVLILEYDSTDIVPGGAGNAANNVAALGGSSYFKLPGILRWFSGNIGLHHVHHLCSRIPNYRLQACLDAAPELNGIAKVITLRESLGCWRLALWDEHRRSLVAFSDLSNR